MNVMILKLMVHFRLDLCNLFKYTAVLFFMFHQKDIELYFLCSNFRFNMNQDENLGNITLENGNHV